MTDQDDRVPCEACPFAEVFKHALSEEAEGAWIRRAIQAKCPGASPHCTVER